VSSLTAEIPLSKIEKISIYINTAKKKLSDIKKETGADYITNAQLFNGNWAASASSRLTAMCGPQTRTTTGLRVG
jgi:hypothetical protein